MMQDLLHQRWPWYVTGPLVGLVAVALLALGNKPFGVSSNLRHICAACLPGNVTYFRSDWLHVGGDEFLRAAVARATMTATPAQGERTLGFYLAMRVLFGIVLTKGELVSWFRIEEALRFKGAYLAEVFASCSR